MMDRAKAIVLVVAAVLGLSAAFFMVVWGAVENKPEMQTAGFSMLSASAGGVIGYIIKGQLSK